MKNLFLLLLLITQTAFAQTGKEKVLVTDLTKIKQISNINVSPDGKRALYTLRTMEQNDENKADISSFLRFLK